jgi:hypothetical protein
MAQSFGGLGDKHIVDQSIAEAKPAERAGGCDAAGGTHCESR